MSSWIEWIEELITDSRVTDGLHASLIVFTGLLLARLINHHLKIKKLQPQQDMLLRRFLSFLVLSVSLGWALHELGFQLGTLLGAAGILTVALGFASQTSVSNIISGLFLIGERPFVVGDLISIGSTTGYVLSIDLLSVRLRTFNNQMIRIPNEMLLKSELTNLTHFPIRRVDLQIGVAYKEDLKKVRQILQNVAEKNPICLEEPKPFFLFKGFGDSSLDIQFSVWSKRENYYELNTAMYLEVKEAFDKNGIEIPFPHRTIYTGAVTDPFPLRLTETKGLHDPS